MQGVVMRRCCAAVAAFSVFLSFGAGAQSSDGQAASRALLLAVEHADGALVAVGEHGVILRSTADSGSWAVVPSGTLKTLTDVAAGSDGRNLWAVGHDELILHSADAGQTW